MPGQDKRLRLWIIIAIMAIGGNVYQGTAGIAWVPNRCSDSVVAGLDSLRGDLLLIAAANADLLLQHQLLLKAIEMESEGVINEVHRSRLAITGRVVELTLEVADRPTEEKVRAIVAEDPWRMLLVDRFVTIRDTVYAVPDTLWLRLPDVPGFELMWWNGVPYWIERQGRER